MSFWKPNESLRPNSRSFWRREAGVSEVGNEIGRNAQLGVGGRVGHIKMGFEIYTKTEM